MEQQTPSVVKARLFKYCQGVSLPRPPFHARLNFLTY